MLKNKLLIIFLLSIVLISCNTRAKKEAMQSYMKGRELGLQGKFEEALKMFKQAIDIYPKLPEAHNGAGFAYYKMKEYDKAEEEFLKAIDLKRDYFKPYSNLGDLYFETRIYGKAIETWQKYLFIDPNVAELHIKVGHAKSLQVSVDYYNLSEALKHFQ